MADAKAIGGDRYELGEGPVWCPQEQALYWVDIFACRVLRLRPSNGDIAEWTLPETVGSLVVRQSGGLVLALKHRFAAFNPADDTLETLATVEHDKPENRFNDGRCDRQGRFFAGTMHERGRAPSGTLWRLDTDLQTTAIFNDATVPNSLCWSPDGKVMYWADSPAKTIWAYDYDQKTGTPSDRRVFVDLTDSAGAPDGSTVDAAGCLWNAEYGASRVVRYLADGTVDRIIELPARQPTCCAFGGPSLRTLYVTTAAQGLSAAERSAQPLNGALLAVETDVEGLPEPRFDG